MERLRDYLASLPAGPVAETEALATEVAACWEHFTGSSAARIPAAEVLWRLRNAVWRSPLLSFDLASEAQGEAGLAGPAALRWEMDVENETAAIAAPAHHGAAPTRPRLDMAELAEQIVRLILAHRQDHRLRWYSDGSVRVAVGTILPEGVGFKQTISNRRRKFRRALEEQLPTAGWRKVKDYVFAPPSDQTHRIVHGARPAVISTGSTNRSESITSS